MKTAKTTIVISVDGEGEEIEALEEVINSKHLYKTVCDQLRERVKENLMDGNNKDTTIDVKVEVEEKE